MSGEICVVVMVFPPKMGNCKMLDAVAAAGDRTTTSVVKMEGVPGALSNLAANATVYVVEPIKT